MGLCGKLNCCSGGGKKGAKKKDGDSSKKEDNNGKGNNATTDRPQSQHANGDVKDGADEPLLSNGGKEASPSAPPPPVYAKVDKDKRQSEVNSAPPPLPPPSLSPLSSPPKKAGFLVSFVVDSRGSAMTGCRGSGIRLIIPPGAVEQPVRVTCRFVRSHGGHQVKFALSTTVSHRVRSYL